MSFSDDYAPTFSGDDTNDIFGAPDMVQISPTTTERVVDTQSGFLVVIKRVDSRLALSVKRRLGTPPVSSILLTPDESLQLSRILAGPVPESFNSGRLNKVISPDVDNWLASIDDLDNSDDDACDLDAPSIRDPHSRAYTAKRPRTRRRNMRPAKFSKKQIIAATAAILLLPVLAFGGYKAFTLTLSKSAPKPVAAPLVVVPSQSDRIDKFARTFVSDMLDFNPSSYRVSQVHAMANMSPELMNKYWQETHFPLTPEQLKSSPQGMTLMITKVEQDRVAEKVSDVDLFAELVSADKVSSPVHLKLTVCSTDDGQLRVFDQKDLSAKK